MCTILAWAGTLPPGMISALITEAEERGRDSTGIAYRDGTKTEIFRRAVSPRTFVREHQADLKAARTGGLGIAHARRASRGMPINSVNAHPFTYRRFVFAHNGAIRNWKELRAVALTSGKLDDYDKTYLQNVQTDSMLLGPAIAQRNFRDVMGSMGVVWVEGPNAYCFHSAKELASITMEWHSAQGPTHKCTIVASTLPIIIRAQDKSLADHLDVTSSHYKNEIEENVLYQVLPDELKAVTELDTNPSNSEDAYTSQKAEA